MVKKFVVLVWYLESNHLTNNLRVIQHAWHFCYALVFGGDGGMREHRYCVPHTLIGRYVS
ncbi:TPA: DUF3265 domain-containing protein [Vibrio vulnificus]|nr:DUF3265 domain-containing protein [Vibrio vulnificus]HDY8053306.1 DUF3265 domain-containing protein [Vibrio vulnificus]HDY8057885.1 DUF3265 domain-containing protein [Vibrio vulnificus]